MIGEITEPELPAFLDTQVEPTREDLLVTEGEKWLDIISPVFQRDNKWRLSDGQVTFWARILDEGFLDRVDMREEVFGKGDRVRVRFRESQHLDEAGRLVTETDVLQVRDHRPAPSQTNLFNGQDTES